MKILIVGSGFTGCVLARLLKDLGNNLLIIEKSNHIGGLSYSKVTPNGIIFEPYGARVFHTKNPKIKEFILKFSKFNEYKHKKGIILDKQLLHFPISLNSIMKMPNGPIILKELNNKPSKINKTNFESYMISVFGKTLYELAVYNYTKKMWGKEPCTLTAEWASDRMELRAEDEELFKDEWQGLPINGYTELFNKLIENIPIIYNRSDFNSSDCDLVIYSGRIDNLIYLKDSLPYRSLRFDYKVEEKWENYNYGTINLPNHKKYIRKANFKVLYKKKSAPDFIQYQEPIRANKQNLPMYPINTKENKDLFNNYLHKACELPNVLPVGRLGLYKYINMDEAVSLAMEIAPLAIKWRGIKIDDRFSCLNNILKKY